MFPKVYIRELHKHNIILPEASQYLIANYTTDNNNNDFIINSYSNKNSVK